MNENTEIATRANREIMALRSGAELKPVIPTTLEEAFRFAQMVVQAGLAPASYESEFKIEGGGFEKRPDPQKVVVGILTALELGVPPLQGLSGIAIINGRPSVWGDLAVALIQSKGLIKDHDVVETGTFPNDDFAITCRYWRVGQEKPYEGKFSIADAKKANLWNNPKKAPWVYYPRRMLFNRARAMPLRDGFSDALKGLAIADEVQDIHSEPKGPVSTDFLAETSQIAVSKPEKAPEDASVVSAPAIAYGEESALQRGLRLLHLCRTAADVSDLSASVAEEVKGTPDKVLWGVSISEKLSELAAQK